MIWEVLVFLSNELEVLDVLCWPSLMRLWVWNVFSLGGCSLFELWCLDGLFGSGSVRFLASVQQKEKILCQAADVRCFNS